MLGLCVHVSIIAFLHVHVWFSFAFNVRGGSTELNLNISGYYYIDIDMHVK